MSRVGKKPIDIPKDVIVTLKEKNLSIKGKFGLLERELKDLVTLSIEDEKIIIHRIDDNKKTREYHGLIRALISGLIRGIYACLRTTKNTKTNKHKQHNKQQTQTNQ